MPVPGTFRRVPDPLGLREDDDGDHREHNGHHGPCRGDGTMILIEMVCEEKQSLSIISLQCHVRSLISPPDSKKLLFENPKSKRLCFVCP